MNDRIDLKEDDVLSMSSRPFDIATTFTISEFMAKVGEFANPERMTGAYNSKVKLFFDGVECRLLQAEGVGWKKGKVRFRLEFIPDEPETLSQPQAVLLNPNQPASPLADLRAELNLNNE